MQGEQSDQSQRQIRQRSKVFGHIGRCTQDKNVLFTCTCGKCYSQQTQSHKCKRTQDVRNGSIKGGIQFIYNNDGRSGQLPTKICTKCFITFKYSHQCEHTTQNINVALLRNKQFGDLYKQQIKSLNVKQLNQRRLQYLRILLQQRNDTESKYYIRQICKQKKKGVNFSIDFTQLKQSLFIPTNRCQMLNIMASIVFLSLRKQKIFLNQLFRFSFPGFRQYFERIPHNDILCCMGPVYHAAWKIQQKVIQLLKLSQQFKLYAEVLQFYKGKIVSQSQIYKQLNKNGLNMFKIQQFFVRSVPYVYPQKERLIKIGNSFMPFQISKQEQFIDNAVQYGEKYNWDVNYNKIKSFSSIYYSIQQAFNQSYTQGKSYKGKQCNYQYLYSMPFQQMQQKMLNKKPQQRKVEIIKQKYIGNIIQLQNSLRILSLLNSLSFDLVCRSIKQYKEIYFWQCYIKKFSYNVYGSIFNEKYFNIKQFQTQQQQRFIKLTQYLASNFIYILHKQKLWHLLQPGFLKVQITRSFEKEQMMKVYEQNVYMRLKTYTIILQNGDQYSQQLQFQQFFQKASKQGFLKQLVNGKYIMQQTLVSYFRAQNSSKTLIYFDTFKSFKPLGYNITQIAIQKQVFSRKVFKRLKYKIREDLSQNYIYKKWLQQLQCNLQQKKRIILHFVLSKKLDWSQSLNILKRFDDYLDQQCQWFNILCQQYPLISGTSESNSNLIFIRQHDNVIKQICQQKQIKEVKSQYYGVKSQYYGRLVQQWCLYTGTQMIPSPQRRLMIIQQKQHVQRKILKYCNQLYEKYDNFMTNKKYQSRRLLRFNQAIVPTVISIWNQYYAQQFYKQVIQQNLLALQVASLWNKKVSEQWNNLTLSQLKNRLSKKITQRIIPQIQKEIIKKPYVSKLLKQKDLCLNARMYINSNQLSNFQCDKILMKIVSKQYLRSLYQNGDQSHSLLFWIFGKKQYATRYYVMLQTELLKASKDQFYDITKLVQKYSRYLALQRDQPLLPLNQFERLNKVNQNVVELQLDSQDIQKQYQHKQIQKTKKIRKNKKQSLKKVFERKQEQIQIVSIIEPQIVILQSQKCLIMNVVQDQQSRIYWQEIQKQKNSKQRTGGGFKPQQFKQYIQISSEQQNQIQQVHQQRYSSSSSQQQQNIIQQYRNEQDQRQFKVLFQMIQQKKQQKKRNLAIIQIQQSIQQQQNNLIQCHVQQQQSIQQQQNNLIQSHVQQQQRNLQQSLSYESSSRQVQYQQSQQSSHVNRFWQQRYLLDKDKSLMNLDQTLKKKRLNLLNHKYHVQYIKRKQQKVQQYSSQQISSDQQDERYRIKVNCNFCNKKHHKIGWQTQYKTKKIISKNRRQVNQQLKKRGKYINFKQIDKLNGWKVLQRRQKENLRTRLLNNYLFQQQRQIDQQRDKRMNYVYYDDLWQESQDYSYGHQSIDLNLSKVQMPWPKTYKTWLNQLNRQIKRSKTYNQNNLISAKRQITHMRYLQSQKNDLNTQLQFIRMQRTILQQQNDQLHQGIMKRKISQIKYGQQRQLNYKVIMQYYQKQVESQQQNSLLPMQVLYQHVKIDQAIQQQAYYRGEYGNDQSSEVVQLQHHHQSSEVVQLQHHHPIFQLQPKQKAIIKFTRNHTCSLCKHNYVLQKANNQGVRMFFRCRNDKCQNNKAIQYTKANNVQQFFRTHLLKKQLNQSEVEGVNYSINQNNIYKIIKESGTITQPSVIFGKLTQLQIGTNHRQMSKQDSNVIADYFNNFSKLDLEIKKSAIGGKGVFATQNISKDFLVAVYSGQIYIDYQCPQVGWIQIRQNDGRTLDHQVLMYPKKYVNLGRYLNSSKSPNCYGKWVIYQGLPLYILKTLIKVQKGTQLTWDYGIHGEQFSKKKSGK